MSAEACAGKSLGTGYGQRGDKLNHLKGGNMNYSDFIHAQIEDGCCWEEAQEAWEIYQLEEGEADDE